MTTFATAPANIALIKYMGKMTSDGNIPLNPSLSYTLDDCQSYCELTPIEGNEDCWEPLEAPGAHPFLLSESAVRRYLSHLSFLKSELKSTQAFIVRSCNNFPANSGLASSASSFAALTKAAVRAISALNNQPELSEVEMAALSQRGSGSSCRSFFSPFALWDETGVKAIDLPYEKWIHHVVMISHEEKSVSSSEAHRRVLTSPLIAGRPERATQRLHDLITALQQQSWQTAFNIVWDEFTDMHALFATASDPFHYINEATQIALDDLKHYWNDNQDGPLVTLDAGPNIHLLFRPDQADMAQSIKEYFLQTHDVI